MKVNFLLVGLILLRETSNCNGVPITFGFITTLQCLPGSQNNSNKCVERFLHKPCLSVKPELRHRRDSFETLCNETIDVNDDKLKIIDGSYIDVSSKTYCFRRENTDTVIPHECGGETQKTCRMKISKGKLEEAEFTFCCDGKAGDCREKTQTCGMKISGDNVEVTILPSCCDGKAGDCTGDDNDSRVSVSITTSTSIKDSTTPSTSTKDSTTQFTSTKDSPTPSTSTKDSTTQSTSTKDSTIPSTSIKDSTTPSTSIKDSTTPSTSTKGTNEPSTSNNDPTFPSTSTTEPLENPYGFTSGSTDTGTLAGGIVGGLLGGVAITIVVVMVWWSCRRRRQIDPDAISSKQNLANLRQRDHLLSSPI